MKNSNSFESEIYTNSTRMKIGIILASFAAGCEYSEHPQHAKCMSDCTSEMAECSKQCEPEDAQCQSECARDLITCENGKQTLILR